MEPVNAEVRDLLDELQERRTIDVCRWLLPLLRTLPVADLLPIVPFVASARATLLPGRRWEFARRSQGCTEVAVIPACRLADRALIVDDLIAFPPNRPNDWALATGRASLLGEIEARDPIALRESRDLRAVANPLDWLRAAGRAVHILRPEAAALALPVSYLIPPRRLVCDTEELARHLRRVLHGLHEAESLAFADRTPVHA